MSNDHAPNRRDEEPVLLTARWVVGHRDDRHVLLDNGEVPSSYATILSE